MEILDARDILLDARDILCKCTNRDVLSLVEEMCKHDIGSKETYPKPIHAYIEASKLTHEFFHLSNTTYGDILLSLYDDGIADPYLIVFPCDWRKTKVWLYSLTNDAFNIRLINYVMKL